MTVKPTIPQKRPDGDIAGPQSSSASVAAFLDAVRAAPQAASTEARGRLIFSLDATMSRQPTWDLACRLQAEMFRETARIGGLDVQLVYFRGLSECRASAWTSDPERLAGLMGKITCQGGNTQIGRVLTHIAAETRGRKVQAVVYVGDAMEEDIDRLCVTAGELALLGVPVFAFQEGFDPAAEQGLREIARITKGAWSRFDPGSASQLADLLRAAAAYASGGRAALKALSARDGGGAQRLLAQMGR